VLTLLFYIFIGVVSIQLAYYFLIFSRFSFGNSSQNLSPNEKPISIIICAKNESKNLNKNIELTLNQSYTLFEVIVVNDASTDNSLEILKAFQKKYPQLKIVNIPVSSTYTGNKKNAITKGIEKAMHSHLLFTDADCKPISRHWIRTMAAQFSNKKQLILGYGAYQKIEHSFLNKLIRFETLMTAIQYFSYARIGLPYMGVGRNLAYTKAVFQQANGLESHKHIKSGDDDLLINQIATSKNTSYCVSKQSFTISEPQTTFASWFKQKRRHITTATHYKPIFQFLLGLFYLSQFLFWILAIILLTFSFHWQLVIVLIAIRLITQYIILGKSAKRLHEKDLILGFPIFDFVIVMIQLSVFIRNLIAKPKSW